MIKDLIKIVVSILIVVSVLHIAYWVKLKTPIATIEESKEYIPTVQAMHFDNFDANKCYYYLYTTTTIKSRGMFPFINKEVSVHKDTTKIYSN